MTRRKTPPIRRQTIQEGHSFPSSPSPVWFICRRCKKPLGAVIYSEGNGDDVVSGWRLTIDVIPVMVGGFEIPHPRDLGTEMTASFMNALRYRPEDRSIVEWLVGCRKCKGRARVTRSEVAGWVAEWKVTRRRKACHLDPHEPW